MKKCYRIKNWNGIYENNRSREIENLSWVVMPNNFDSDGYTMIMDEKDGAEIFGCWVSVVKLASKCDPRGVLMRSEGNPHDYVSISRITRISEKKIARMLDFCLNNCKWLEIIDFQSGAVIPQAQAGAVIPQAQAGAVIPQAGAVIPQAGAVIPQAGAVIPQAGAIIPQAGAPRVYARALAEGNEEKEQKEGNEMAGAIAPVTTSIFVKEKKKMLDWVFLTDDEYSRLRVDFGLKFLEACIFRLNAYLANNEKKRRQYKDHNLVIRSWVKDEVEKKLQPRPEKKPDATAPLLTTSQPMTAEQVAEAEEGLRIFREQTNKILKNVTVNGN